MMELTFEQKLRREYFVRCFSDGHDGRYFAAASPEDALRQYLAMRHGKAGTDLLIRPGSVINGDYVVCYTEDPDSETWSRWRQDWFVAQTDQWIRNFSQRPK